MRLYSVEGTYGRSKTPSTIFVAEDRRGGKHYVAEGSVNVNYTYDEIEEGVNIEYLNDVDMFTAGSPIHSEEDLEYAIEGGDDLDDDLEMMAPDGSGD